MVREDIAASETDRDASEVRTQQRRTVRRNPNTKWVKRRLKTGKWYGHDENGNMVKHLPGQIVEVPEHLAQINPEQFALDEASFTAPPSQPLASSAPIVGAREPSEPSEEEEQVPSNAPIPSTPSEATKAIPPHENAEPIKGERKTKTLPGPKATSGPVSTQRVAGPSSSPSSSPSSGPEATSKPYGIGPKSNA